MKTRMFFSVLLVALLVLAVCEAQAWRDRGDHWPLHDNVRKVNCTRGETITHALELWDGNPITIQVKGTCNENVEIVRDDVTLIAHPWGGAVNGADPNTNTIDITGARTVIDGLMVTGGRSGINVYGSGGSTIHNCTVKNTGLNGIVFYQGGRGTVDQCTIQNNGGNGIVIEAANATVTNSTISSNTGNGILLQRGGSARIGINDRFQYAGNTINNNQGNGILIYVGGSAYIGGNTIDGNGTNPNSAYGRLGISIIYSNAVLVGNNRITGSGASGINVAGSSVDIGNPGMGGLPTTGEFANVISGNANGGISGNLGASLMIKYAIINGNTGYGVFLNSRSTARIFGGTVNNNTDNGILLANGGGLELQDPAVTVTGNTSFGLQCNDNESSFNGNISGILGNTGGNVSPNCTGF